MTIRTAAVSTLHGTSLALAAHPAPRRRAVNDNAFTNAMVHPSDKVLHAALRHFANDGLGAARSARLKAEDAFFAGDRQSYNWWLSITRILDRRLATHAINHRSENTPRVEDRSVELVR